MKNLSTSSRLILLVTVMSSLLLVVGAIGLIGIYRANDALKTVYVDRTVPMWQLSEIQRLMQRTWLLVAIGQDTKSAEFLASYSHDGESNLETVRELYAAYLTTYLTPEEVVLAEKFRQSLDKIEYEGLRPALAALRASNYTEARRLQLEVMIPYADSYRTTLQALTKLQLDEASKEYKAGMARFDNIRRVAIVSMLAGLCFALMFGGFLVRSIIRSKAEFEQSLHAKRDLERQLQQSQKVQALGQLTGGIAHDFNNILAAILGYSNLALEKHVPDNTSKLAKYLREIVAASERARDLVAKMLTFTRTQPSESVSLISPAAVVHEVESMMGHSIPSSMALRTRIEQDVHIMMDAGELNQVLVNLVINARDAIQGHGHGHGQIDIVVHKVEVADQISLTSQRRFSGTFLGLDVIDTGVGITPEHLTRVFDPFFTTKDVGKGTGLGLSMVQGIMTRAGGHILIQSTPGKGSRFQLLFPLNESIPSVSSAQRVEVSRAPGHDQWIWVVDDEPALTGYLGELLNSWGYQTRAFNDPKEALLAFRTESPNIDLLISDFTMPGLSGADLVDRVHAIDPNVPVIFCTGFSDGLDRVKMPKQSYCKLLVKPVSSADLASALAAAFSPETR